MAATWSHMASTCSYMESHGSHMASTCSYMESHGSHMASTCSYMESHGIYMQLHGVAWHQLHGVAWPLHAATWSHMESTCSYMESHSWHLHTATWSHMAPTCSFMESHDIYMQLHGVTYKAFSPEVVDLAKSSLKPAMGLQHVLLWVTELKIMLVYLFNTVLQSAIFHGKDVGQNFLDTLILDATIISVCQDEFHSFQPSCHLKHYMSCNRENTTCTALIHVI